MLETPGKTANEKISGRLSGIIGALFLSGCATLPNGTTHNESAVLARDASRFVGDRHIPANRREIPFFMDQLAESGVRNTQTFFRDNRDGENSWNEAEARALYDHALKEVRAYTRARHTPIPPENALRVRDTT